MTTRNEKAIVADALERLAAIEGLIKLSRIAVRRKAGDSGQLYRADQDLGTALEGLEIVQSQISDLTTTIAKARSVARRYVFTNAATIASGGRKRGA